MLTAQPLFVHASQASSGRPEPSVATSAEGGEFTPHRYLDRLDVESGEELQRVGLRRAGCRSEQDDSQVGALDSEYLAVEMQRSHLWVDENLVRCVKRRQFIGLPELSLIHI